MSIADVVPASWAFGIDGIITAAAILVAAVALFRWFRRGRDPLADAPPRPNALREDAILFAVCVYLLAAAVIGKAAETAFGSAEDVRACMLTGSGAQIAGIVVCLALVRRFATGGVRQFLRGPKTQRWHSVRIVLLVCVVGIGLCPWVAEATVRTLQYFAPEQPITPHPTIQALRGPPLPLWIRVGLWLGAAAVAPIAEELFFRGILQTFLVRVLPSRWTAVVLTAIAFGVVHVPQFHTVVALTLLGVLIGYAYERTGSLAVPIAIHAAFNLKTLVWEAWGAYVA